MGVVPLIHAIESVAAGISVLLKKNTVTGTDQTRPRGSFRCLPLVKFGADAVRFFADQTAGVGGTG